MKNDHNQLRKVLENFEQIDIELLDLLAYHQECEGSDDCVIRNSALNIALGYGNNRSVEIILQYMSKIRNMDSSMFFKTLFPKLFEYRNFQSYLINMQVENVQMQNKSILKVQKPFDN